jgi:hypothetical protein
MIASFGLPNAIVCSVTSPGLSIKSFVNILGSFKIHEDRLGYTISEQTAIHGPIVVLWGHGS